jgi:hypothetical protein
MLAVALVAVKLLVFSKDGRNDKEDGDSQRAPSSGNKIPDGWTRITIPEGPFEIAMPGKPLRTTELLTAGVDAGLTNFIYVYDSGEGNSFPIYGVSCTSVPNADQRAQAQALGADAHREFERDHGIASLANGKLIESKQVTHDGHIGLEYIAKGSEYMVRSRAFIVDDRSYNLVVAGEREHLKTPEAEAFLGSFKVKSGTKSSEPPSEPKSTPGTASPKLPAGWTKITIPEGPLEVMLPGKPKRNPRPKLDDGREDYQYILEVTPNSGYIISLSSVPNAQQSADLRRLGDAEFHLDTGRDNSLKSSPGMRLLSEKKIRYATYPGREELKETNLAQFRSRFFWIENRGFLLMVLGNEREVHSAEAQFFLDSFKLLAPKGSNGSTEEPEAEPKTVDPKPTPAPSPRTGEWVALFNSKDLTGWHVPEGGTGKWTVQEGMIVSSGPASYLFSERGDYQDFHLRAEVQINDRGNSGLFFRTQEGPGLPKGYEAQINATHHDPQKTGSLFNIAKVTSLLHRPGEWFTLEVIAEGEHIVILVNDKKVVDVNDSKYQKGHIALQQHGTETVVKFRRLEIKEMGEKTP